MVIETYGEAKKRILKEHPESIVTRGMKTKLGFIFALRPKNFDSSKQLLDPYFQVTTTGKVQEYSPVMDPEEFKYALSHIIE